ncbi:2-hydroxyhepta-2,4-diene-1,7-dioate isomerase [bacterium]|nr:2-hydroxyhepta-2,4-diene-1,7-dioate isomerase [bacterium]
MKIICVGRNYVKHVEELKNKVPDKPVIFLKPDTARLKDGKPFFYPEHSSNIHYEAELVVRISKNGRHIQPQFAHSYYNEITIGIDLTARDTQQELKENGLPWELAKAFDDSAVVGNFITLTKPVSELSFSLEKNGKVVQKGLAAHMIYPLDELIAFISKYFFLKQGDLIFTGTPEGVGPIAIGDEYVGKIENETLLNLNIK